MNIKQFSIAISFALILLTVASTPLSGQQTGRYNPWLDYNEDGKIDIQDLSSLSHAYSSSGDPTKNVTIAGHVTKLHQLAVSVSLPPSTSWDSGLIWIDGYSKITVLISVLPSSSNRLQVYAHDYTGLSGPSWMIEKVDNIGISWIKTYDVMNQQIRIFFFNLSPTDTITLNADIYLMV